MSRLKLEIVELVNEILDKIPSWMWKSSVTTFFDPSIGGGQFVKEIMERLKKEGHSKSNIAKRIYGFAENQVALNYVINKHKLLGNFTIGTHNSNIPITWPKEFNVVCGNPPFQNSSNTTQVPLWPLFMNLATNITKENGYITLITPKTWLLSEIYTNSNRIGSDLKRTRMINIVPYNLIYLSIDCISKYFSVGSSFCYYVIQKSKHNDSILTTIEYMDNGQVCTLKKQTNNLDIILSNQNPIVESIYNKIIKSDIPKIVGDFKNPEGFQGSSHLKKQPDKIYKYKCLSTSAHHKRGEFFYSKKPHPNMYRNKIIYSFSGYANPFYDNGKLGTCHHGRSIFVKDENDGKKYLKYLKSKPIQFLVKIYPKSAIAVDIGMIVEKLPNIDILPDVTDQELYKYFKLTNEEIDLIEREIK